MKDRHKSKDVGGRTTGGADGGAVRRSELKFSLLPPLIIIISGSALGSAQARQREEAKKKGRGRKCVRLLTINY